MRAHMKTKLTVYAAQHNHKHNMHTDDLCKTKRMKPFFFVAIERKLSKYFTRDN